jgi:tRNA threonylcarbamoyladenosine biosynthesis protein TsaE
MKYIITKTPLGTKAFGKKMAKEFLAPYEQPRRSALIIGLEGDLGGGKTTFVQGFAKGLGIKEKILSPTFVILKKFSIPKFFITPRAEEPKFKIFYHIDCYRIQGSQELLDLGFREIISDPKNIVIIEWADRVLEILPKDTIFLKFNFVNINIREIITNTWIKKD